jgi:cytochrome bd-type quinol oxidase subunit 2
MSFFRRGLSEPFDAVRFSSSWILPPIMLCVLRASFSLYMFACIIAFLVMDGEISTHEVGHYFSYFTSLTYFGLAFYFAFAALHSGSYARSGTPMLARWPKFLQILHSIFYTTITTYPFLVTSKSLYLLYPT